MIGKEHRQHLKMVVIGKTGAGKSTFINTLVNHFYDVGYDQDRFVAISQTVCLEEDAFDPGHDRVKELSCNIKEFDSKQGNFGGTQAESQTTKPNIYDFENPYLKLTVVDTPGLGDTRGMAQDRENIQEIAAAVAALTDFNAIVLVHKATDCRLDAVLRYMLKEFQGMLPKECKKNILVAFTAVTNSKKIDARPALVKIGIPVGKNFFCFENTSLIPPMFFYGSSKVDPKSKEGKEYMRAMDFWDEGREQMQRLLSMATKPIALPGKSLLEISVRKQALVQIASKHADKYANLRDKIKVAKKSKAEIEQIQQQIAAYRDSHTYESRMVQKSRKISVTTQQTKNIAPGKVTQCMVCKSLCHNPCQLDQVYSQGHINLIKCTAFGSRENCSKCQHSYHHHAHSQELVENVTVEKEDTYAEIEQVQIVDATKRQQLEDNKTHMVQIQELYEQYEEEIRGMNVLMEDTFLVIAYLNHQLEKMAFSSHNEYFLEYLDHMKDECQKNKALTKEEKTQELALLEDAEKTYLTIKQICAYPHAKGLSQSQLEELQHEFYKLENDQMDMVRKHQKDRKPFELDYGMKILDEK